MNFIDTRQFVALSCFRLEDNLGKMGPKALIQSLEMMEIEKDLSVRMLDGIMEQFKKNAIDIKQFNLRQLT